MEHWQNDKRAIEALGSVLEGSERPIVITSSTAMGSAKPGGPATEDYFDPDHPNPRVASELPGHALSERGVNVSVVRLSQIHDTRKQGLVTEAIELAHKKGVSAYVGEGLNCWSGTHASDTAHLLRRPLERQEPGARSHATAEGAIPFRDIAQAVGRSVGVPVKSMTPDEAAAHFTWLSALVGRTCQHRANSRSSGWELDRLAHLLPLSARTIPERLVATGHRSATAAATTSQLRQRAFRKTHRSFGHVLGARLRLLLRQQHEPARAHDGTNGDVHKRYAEPGSTWLNNDLAPAAGRRSPHRYGGDQLLEHRQQPARPSNRPIHRPDVTRCAPIKLM